MFNQCHHHILAACIKVRILIQGVVGGILGALLVLLHTQVLAFRSWAVPRDNKPRWSLLCPTKQYHILGVISISYILLRSIPHINLRRIIEVIILAMSTSAVFFGISYASPCTTLPVPSVSACFPMHNTSLNPVTAQGNNI